MKQQGGPKVLELSDLTSVNIILTINKVIIPKFSRHQNIRSLVSSIDELQMILKQHEDCASIIEH